MITMKNDAYLNAHSQLYKAAAEISLDEEILTKLDKPEHLHKRVLSIELDNGESREFLAFRSQHSSILGPYKGGLRFHEEVSEEEVTALSMWMSWKCSLMGLPWGGGKGGIKLDPHELSKTELERLSRAYVDVFQDVLGENTDIPAPDVNTNETIIGWMVDEYTKKTGKDGKKVFTGKPLDLGGSRGRTEATGFGGAYILSELSEAEGLQPENTTIAIQGFGNVGYYFAELAFDLGYKIVAISDSKTALYNPSGIDPRNAGEYKKNTSSLAGFEDASTITNAELLELDVEILVPSALENVINEENAYKIKADYILELANGPVTKEADEILDNRLIVVIPDIIANAGGVSVSYFEWQQNQTGVQLSKDEVLQKLEKLMKETFRKVWKIQQDKSISTRLAAYVVALERIASKYKANN